MMGRKFVTIIVILIVVIVIILIVVIVIMLIIVMIIHIAIMIGALSQIPRAEQEGVCWQQGR